MEKWGKALLVVVLGLGIVFSVLAIIMFVLIIMEKIFAPKSNKNVSSAPKADDTPIKASEVKNEVKGNDGEIIAAISAALCAYLNTSSHNIKIKSYRKLGESNSAWNRASRNENIYKGF